MEKNLKDYLTIRQAAKYLGASHNTLRNWEKNGFLTADAYWGKKKTKLYLPKSLDEFFKRNCKVNK